MANYYVIRDTGSDSNGGTSEADAFENLVTGISAAFEAGTGGHVVWVKGNGLTYHIPNGVSTDFSLGLYASTVVGYGVTSGDDCVGGTYPQINYQLVNLATGWSFRNFNIYYDAVVSASEFGTNPNWGSAFTSSQRDCKNINIHLANSHSSGQYGGVFGSYVNNGHRNIRITASPGFDIRNPGQGALGYGNGGVKGHNESVYADLSNCIFPSHNPAYFWNFNSNAHTGLIMFTGHTCIAPDPASYPMIGVAFKYDHNCSNCKIKNCIFVNCDKGIQIYSDYTTQADLVSSWPNTGWLIEDCIFINCNTGIEFETGFDWPYSVRNCAFYNCTTANISGNCLDVSGVEIATQDPWDSVNNRLNEYGMTLLNRQTHKGSGTADFATPDPDRPFHQILGKGTATFQTTDSGSLTLGGHSVGDKVTVSGRTYQLVNASPLTWRRANP